MKVDERIAERRREVRDERRRGRLRRTVLVATLVLLLLAALAVERSSLVALAEVRVEGTQRLDPDTVREAADLPLGTSTLRLRLGDARERVEALPLVATATVDRLDPLTVLVSVTERVPLAVVRGRGGFALIDDDGVVVAAGREDGLPLIDLGSAPPPAPGDHVRDLPALANAHRALRELPGPLRTEVAQYRAIADDALTLELVNGTLVDFGRAERVDEKARSLGAVLDDLGDRVVATIDVRAPRTPVVIP